MTFIDALILSIVEGITEFLPISSTGHLILTSEVLGIRQTNFIKSFEIIIQLGAIMAVVFLYWRLLLKKDVLLPVISGFIPAVIIGFVFYSIIKDHFLGNSSIVVIALFWGGVILIAIELLHKEKDYHIGKIEDLGIKKAFIIGVFQSLSIIPGVSRAAATIIGGLLVGTKRKIAAEFSFILAIPTMIGASGLDIYKSNFSFSQDEILLLLTGFIGSFIVAAIAIKFLIKFIQTHSFIVFGIYRISLALFFWFFILR